MLQTWLWLSMAAPPAEASALCEALQADPPSIWRVRAALEAGDDPADPCPLPNRHPACALLFLLALPVAVAGLIAGPQEVPPVLVAVEAGDPEIVEALLDAGARPPDGTLDAAVSRGHWEVVDLLLARGVPPVLHRLDDGVDRRLALEHLLERGIRLDRVEVIVRTRALHDPDAAASLLVAGVPASVLFDAALDSGSVRAAALAMDEAGATPDRSYRLLVESAEQRAWEEVDRLRSAGVGWSLPGYPPATELLAGSMREEPLRVAYAWGLNPAAPEQRGLQALIEAVEEGHAGVVAALLDGGAPWDRSVFLRAVAEGRWPVIAPFLEHGADPAGTDLAARARSGAFDDAVTAAAARGDLADLEHQISLGAPPDGGGDGALITASDEAVMTWLLAAGADPSRLVQPLSDPRAPSRMHLAVQKDRTALARLLVEEGARPLPGEPDLVLLSLAHDNDALARLLLDAGYPHTAGAVVEEIFTCRTDLLAAYAWPRLPRENWRAALEASPCAGEVQAARRRAPSRRR